MHKARKGVVAQCRNGAKLVRIASAAFDVPGLLQLSRAALARKEYLRMAQENAGASYFTIKADGHHWQGTHHSPLTTDDSRFTIHD